jgi:hypothetical protein
MIKGMIMTFNYLLGFQPGTRFIIVVAILSRVVGGCWGHRGYNSSNLASRRKLSCWRVLG